MRRDLLIVDLIAGEQAGWTVREQVQAEVETRGLPVIVFSTSPALLDRALALATPGAPGASSASRSTSRRCWPWSRS